MKKAYFVTLTLLILILAGLYVGGIYVGHNYFLPRTFVNGQEVSYKQADAIEELVVEDDTQLVVHGVDEVEVIDMADFGYKMSLEKSAEQMIEDQNQMAWPLTLFKDTNITDGLVISYNESELEKTVDQMDMLDPSEYREPQDAYIRKNKDGHYEIVPEDDGNMPYPEKIYEAIKAAVDSGEHEVYIDPETSYHKATVRSDDPKLNEEIEKLKSINEMEIVVDMVDAEEVLDTYKLLDMTYVDEAGNIIADEAAVDEFILYLEDNYDAFKVEQPFYTHDGRRILVGGNDDDGIGYAMDTYGFLMDNYATKLAIIDAIESGVSQTVDAVWMFDPAWARNTRNGIIGDTYIEISLDEQHVWAFWDGELLVDDDIVTGLYADPMKRSPTGLFRIWDKASPATLTGEMAGEEWESHVDYWMGITWTGVGLHNAPWRGAFGGDIYLWNGSHGCLNFTYDTAEILYTTYGYGAPVVIY